MDIHKNYEKEIAAAWLDRFETEQAANYESLKRKAGISRRANIIKWSRITAIAACIAIAAVGGAMLQRGAMRQMDGRLTEITVPEGSRMKVMLPDNTEVWLAGGSTLAYESAFRERNVTLDGEGFFKVAHDKSRPFSVRSASVDIQVLGTIFDIRNYSRESKAVVDLIDGSVAVTGKTTGIQKTLKPDQRATVDHTSGLITVEETDAARSALWVSGKLYFTDATMDELLKDIERFKGVSFSHSEHLLEGELFSGSIRLDHSVESILRSIDLDHKLVWTENEDTIVITVK